MSMPDERFDHDAIFISSLSLTVEAEPTPMTSGLAAGHDAALTPSLPEVATKQDACALGRLDGPLGADDGRSPWWKERLMLMTCAPLSLA